MEKTGDSASFGGLLRRFRLASGFSQDALAERSGLSARGISDLERGARQAPRRETVEFLAAALDLPPADRDRLLSAVRRARPPAGGAPAAPVPDAAPEAPRHNLPLQLTTFVGREQELAELESWLGRHRLVSLVGAGGIGKTRLGLRAAEDLLGTYPDGAWFVDLAPLADPALVPATVAAVLGVREVTGQPVETTLVEGIRGRHLLLILDNCEHLVGACARVAESVLRRCPRVGVVATSREPLGVAGERVFRVPPLAHLDPRRLVPTPESVAALAAGGAGRLFVERAVAGDPRFRLTARNAVAVADVCYRLDGIPLAIELAAARVRALSVEQIADRLDDRFRLLTGGSRTALPRQQTLRALIDWSHDLLTEPERRLLRRLSVFAGGWTLAAAEAVCADPAADRQATLPADSILDRLTSLVEKSLVTFEDGDAGPRYGLNETVRQYAREKLAGSGEEDAVRSRHFAACRALAAEAEPALRTVAQRDWMRRLATEQGNLRAALDWGQTRDGRRGVRLTLALFWFWYFRSEWGEARRWLERALAGRSPADADACPRIHARLVACAGEVAVYQADFAVARERLAEALERARALGDRSTVAYALLFQAGIGHLGEEVLRTRRSLLEEAVDLFRVLGDDWGLARALQRLGLVDMREGDDAAAGDRLDESLRLFESGGDTWGTAMARYCRGLLDLRRREYAAARVRIERGLAGFREVGNLGMTAQSLNSLGDIARATGDDDRAVLLYEEALARFRDVERGWGAAGTLHNLGYLALRRGGPARAAALFAGALSEFQADANEHGTLECLTGLGAVAAATGDAARAVRLFAAADAAFARLRRPLTGSNAADYERALAAARGALSPAEFDAAWQVGAGLSAEEARAEAGVIIAALTPAD